MTRARNLTQETACLYCGETPRYALGLCRNHYGVALALKKDTYKRGPSFDVDPHTLGLIVALFENDVVPADCTSRPTWDTYFLLQAMTASVMSTCPRKHVGAVVVRDRRVLSTGFNGSMPGSPHCTDDGCLMEEGHCVRTIHAELNAVGEAGREARGSTLYCSVQPCWPCLKFAVSRGISRVVYSQGYRPDPRKTQMVMDLLVAVEHHSISDWQLVSLQPPAPPTA